MATDSRSGNSGTLHASLVLQHYYVYVYVYVYVCRTAVRRSARHRAHDLMNQRIMIVYDHAPRTAQHDACDAWRGTMVYTRLYQGPGHQTEA
jgi:hypothetical protein